MAEKKEVKKKEEKKYTVRQFSYLGMKVKESLIGIFEKEYREELKTKTDWIKELKDKKYQGQKIKFF